MHSHCGCVKLTVVIICKQFITWEETWFKSCSTQKGRKIQMLPSSCFRWHSPLQNLCNIPLLWWATSKLHFNYKCITNVMCISDIDDYQYQYLKEKTHNNPPYQSVMSIQMWWSGMALRGGANGVCVTEQSGFLKNVSLNKFRKIPYIERCFSTFFVILCIVMQ